MSALRTGLAAIGVVVAAAAVGPEPLMATDPTTAEMPPPLSEMEVIHERIDVHAQRAIVHLSKGTQEERFASRFLLRGVQYGVLGGIYKVDTQVPALRAQALGKGWWTLLEGRSAGCMLEPADEKPILIFGTTVAAQTAVLADALRGALDECGLRRLDVHVTRAGVAPCGEAVVAIRAEGVGVANEPACRSTPAGFCHFYVPPAMYEFRVTCDGEATDPAALFRAVAPGDGVQLETFDFAAAAPPQPVPEEPPPGPETSRPRIPVTPATPPATETKPQTTSPPRIRPSVVGRVRPPATVTPQTTEPPVETRIPSRTIRPRIPSTPPDQAPPDGGEKASQALPECGTQPVRGGPCWTTEDVINSPIDHHAQSAMFRMFARGGLPAAEASQILCAAKTGGLEGVFLPDQEVPALRARAAGSNWWEMIPPGASSHCYEEQPTEGPVREPLIVFRDQIKDDRELVAVALSSAWRNCPVERTVPRCYVATISKPQPQLECPPDTVPGPDGEVCVPVVVCPPGSDPDPSGEGCIERPCPPGMVPDASGELCVLPGQVSTSCTQAEIESQFQQKTDFCAGIKTGIDAACGLGASPCDHLKPVKLGCDLFEKIFGKSIPGAKHPACAESSASFYEKCVLSTLEGERSALPCDLPPAAELQQSYRSWPGRVQ